MIGAAAGRIAVDDRRRIAAVPAAIVAGDGPEIAGLDAMMLEQADAQRVGLLE